MAFKGVYSNKSSFFKGFILLSLIFISSIIHTILAIALVNFFSQGGFDITQNYDLGNQLSVNYLKMVQLFSGVGMFIVPSFIYSYLTNFNFNFNKISRQSSILVIAIIMLITPFIGFLLEWNMKIDFPDWILYFDNNSEAIILAFLKMESWLDLLYTILVIAVVPAIGEELIFRGYLQQKLAKRFGDMHASIFLTAFLFSLIHFHFDGLIPRFVLGILLGYFFYWGRSLWLPILAHFVNNAQGVVLSHPFFQLENQQYSVYSNEKIDPMLALFSLMAVTLLLYIFKQNTAIKKG